MLRAQMAELQLTGGRVPSISSCYAIHTCYFLLGLICDPLCFAPAEGQVNAQVHRHHCLTIVPELPELGESLGMSPSIESCYDVPHIQELRMKRRFLQSMLLTGLRSSFLLASSA